MGDVYHRDGVAMVRMIARTDLMNATVQVQGHQLLANVSNSSEILN
jgi:GMP synthase PP-ATPase subunit